MVANAMLLIIGRALNMLRSQIRAQGRAFEETGGFSERLMSKRIEARDGAAAVDATACPDCGKGMRKRRSAKGTFWGCSGFPECRGTRPV
jgi:four helix bundle suffix protein